MVSSLTLFPRALHSKPVFIRHRTADEIDEANKVDVKSLRDPQTDDDRVQRPEWLVMLGVCTHLGCVPLGQAGDCEYMRAGDPGDVVL